MRPLVLAVLLCGVSPARADEPRPALVELDRESEERIEDGKAGRLAPDLVASWKKEFRAKLEAEYSRLPPTADDTALYARVVARIGDGQGAVALLNRALESDKENPSLLSTKGRVLYEQKDYAGAAESSLQAWEASGRTDENARKMYMMSKGRAAPTRSASAETSLSAAGRTTAVATTADPSIALSDKKPVKAADVPNPASPDDGPAGKKPLWPWSIPFAAGLAGYGYWHGKKDGEGQDGGQGEVSTAFMGNPVLIPGAVAPGVAPTAAAGLGKIAVTGMASAAILLVGGAGLVYTVNKGLDDMIAAQDAYNESIDTHRNDRPALSTKPGGLPGGTEPEARPVYVVRGGEATARNLKISVDTRPHPSGIDGFSVQSAPNRSIEELAAAGRFPNQKISVTTTAKLAAIGVHLESTSGRGYHKTAKTPRPLPENLAARISAAFGAPVPNPARVSAADAAGD